MKKLAFLSILAVGLTSCQNNVHDAVATTQYEIPAHSQLILWNNSGELNKTALENYSNVSLQAAYNNGIFLVNVVPHKRTLIDVRLKDKIKIINQSPYAAQLRVEVPKNTSDVKTALVKL